MRANALGTMFLSLTVDFWQIFEDFYKRIRKCIFLRKRKEDAAE
jgi:hypothetical protein